MPHYRRILIGLALGATAGVSANLAARGEPWLAGLVRLGVEPLGRMWLAALIMVVIPLVVSTLSLGVVGLGGIGRLGRVGALTLLGFLSFTALSTLVGLGLMNAVAPGHRLDPAVRRELLASYSDQAQDAAGLSGKALSIELLVRIVPRNPVQAAASGDMLAVIFFSLMLGLALASLDEARAAPMRRFLESLAHVTVAMIELVMKLAPVGVFCLVFAVTARFGLELLVGLAQYVATVLAGLSLFLVVGYSVVLRLAGRNPVEFFRKSRLVMTTAFSTSSSNATLPTTLMTAETQLGIPREIAGFVLPLGATINMNGTALFEGATVLFLAQVFDVPLGLGQQVVVVLMSVLTAVGTAGVPGGSIPLLTMVLGMVGVPMEGIAIVLGVDRILDMCRTVVNVTGDLVTAAVVARLEALLDRPASRHGAPLAVSE